jgi:hypothetical protein
MQRNTDAMPPMVLRVSNVVSYMLFILINTLSNKGYFGPTNADVSQDGCGCNTCYIRLYSSPAVHVFATLVHCVHLAVFERLQMPRCAEQ